MPTLFVATSNRGKLRDFALAAAVHGWAVEPLPGLSTFPAPEETAPTFAGNADLKARAYSLHSPGLLVLCDDSGLEVDALHGAPGILSARFADSRDFPTAPGLSPDARNNACLLALLAAEDARAGHPVPRSARFRCALSLARDGEVLLRSEGTVAGELLRSPRGSHGFGYDPLFLLPAQDLTLAELPGEQKWEVSHRGEAFRKLSLNLRHYFGTEHV